MPNLPWIFVMGAPRSGTSLLRQLLSNHPHLFISPELRVLELIHFAAVICEHNGAISEETRVSPRSVALGRAYAGLLADQQLLALDRVRYGDKYPPYCLHIGTLNDLFPDALFLHILRDGRDVVASLARTRADNRGWRRGPTIPPAPQRVRDWQIFVQQARAAGVPLGPQRYHEVRYEHLLSDPVSVLRSICSFLGEPFVPALLQGVGGIRPGKSWRETLSPAELRAFHDVPGAEALLQRLGYPPTPHPDDLAVARAAGLAPPAASPLAARLESGASTPALWAAAAREALAAGDRKAAVTALVRAIQDETPDPDAILQLLALSDTPESVFAALNALSQRTPTSQQALSQWSTARGLDPAASAALFSTGEVS